MIFDTCLLENAHIKLIDGDRGKNYPKQSDFSSKGHCLFLSAKNVTKAGFDFSSCSFIGEERHRLLKAGTLEANDIVMTTRGTIGNVGYYSASIKYPVIRINSGMMIFRADKDFWNPRFLYYVLTSPIIQEQILNLTSGSAVPQLPARDLKKFELPQIPLETQNQIEQIISSICDKIVLNEKQNQTLEQIAQAIFKSWFVDFEPVKAKINALEAGGSDEDALLAAMQAISGKDKAQLTQLQTENPEHYNQLRTTAELFPYAMQDSEQGDIPVGWVVSTLGEEFDVTMGQSPPGSTYNEKKEGIPFFQGRRDFGKRFPSERVYSTSPKRMAKKGDTLLSVRAPVGDSNIANSDCCIGRGLAAIRHKSGSSSFTYYSVQQLSSELLSYDSEGTVFGSINQKNLKALTVIKPCSIALNAFEHYVSSLDEAIFTKNHEVDVLAQIRDSLLPKLLSGEIRVNDLALSEEIL